MTFLVETRLWPQRNMLLISLSYLICVVIATQVTNANVTTTNIIVSGTNSTVANTSKSINNVPSPIGTVIVSDSGVTTQNSNNSTAAVNVIEKPNTKQGADASKSNTSINTNDVAKETKQKLGEEVHNRKVTQTQHIPPVVMESSIPVIATNSTKVEAAAVHGASVGAPVPKVQSVLPVPKPIDSKPLALPSNSTNPSSSPEISKSKTGKPVPLHPIVLPVKNNTTPVKNSTVPIPASVITPKKPLITYSVDDDPQLQAIRDKISKSTKQSGPAAEANGALNEPVVLQSSELLNDDYKHRDYIIPIIGLIFAVPILLILANFLSRKLRQYWSKRNYQRMDYLINDMYN